MSSPDRSFRAFCAEVESSGRFPKVRLEASEHGGNLATVSGEVASREHHYEIVEMARQHGFHLLADDLLVHLRSKD